MSKIINNQLELFEGFFPPKACESLMDYLVEQISWRADSITLFGKTHQVPRLQAWYGDKAISYRYSGLTLMSKSWTSELRYIKNRCEALCRELGILTPNESFNGVLINYYRDGQDTVGWHSDDEKELGENPVIASVTFGEQRKFQIRDKTTKQRTDLMLCNGSVLLMFGHFQHHYEHCLPRTKKAMKGRVNLSFRLVKNNAELINS